MKPAKMTIQQAARWAERKDILVRPDRDGGPDWLCAAYSMRDYGVELIGYGNKCYDYLRAQRAAGREDLRVESLQGVVEEMDEEEGEAGCIPEPGWIREWA